MKQVTKERLEKAFRSLDRYKERLTGRDQRIMSKMMRYGFQSANREAAGLPRDPLFLEKVCLEMVVEETTPLEADCAFDRWSRNIKKIDRRRERIQAIQLRHNVSALMRSKTRIGNGVIEHWEPRQDEFIITNDDLLLLKGDRDRLFQFWADHVALNNLSIFVRQDDDWQSTSVESIENKLPLFGWVSINDLSWEKRREIHLFLGSGIYWDDPEVSMWLCATNCDRPSN